jgi:hypothetical protein
VPTEQQVQEASKVWLDERDGEALVVVASHLETLDDVTSDYVAKLLGEVEMSDVKPGSERSVIYEAQGNTALQLLFDGGVPPKMVGLKVH